MTEPQPQVITPERQMAAQQVGGAFNSLHEYLRALEPRDAEGNALLTKQLEFAHARVDEAAMWAIKSVLTFGVPAAPKPAETVAAANETVPEAAPLPTNTPEPTTESI